jgi:hypothetical protein
MNRSRTLALSVLALAALAGTSLAQTSAVVSAGRLTITTSNADQSVKIESKLAPNAVSLFGFAGIADGTTFTSITGVTINTGAGFDKVEADIESTASMDIAINTGAGNAETKVQWKTRPTPAQVRASVTLASAPGSSQLANVEFDNETASALLSLNTGNASEVNAKVLSDDPSASLGVAFTARAPKTNLEIASAASALTVDLNAANNNAALNEIKYVIGQLRPGTVNVRNNVALGSAGDKLEAKVAAFGSTVTVTGTVDTGAGDDLALFEVEGASVITGLSLAGGLGNDFLQYAVKGPFQLSQTLGARLSGGAGDDTLILTTDTAIRGTGLPNDITPVIDGGAGFDLYNAFGQIISCEQRL